MGIEAELVVRVDGERTSPEALWTSPQALAGPAAVASGGEAAPLPGGGVLYFDQGVLEIVTPVIELGPGAPARAVRSLWEQIGHVEERVAKWAEAGGRDVRLEGFSTHYNVSFERPDPARTADALALLLAHILPIPVALTGGNRRSTGIGVRPRGNRIEVTADFTPDPGLMIATASLVVGIVRGATALPSYDLAMLGELPLATVEGVVPGKHSSRRGWLTRDYHFPRSPFTAAVDARLWPTRDGRLVSLRAIARETAWFFRRSLRENSDAFSFRLLFSILEGRTPSLLELPDRPGAYEDIGRAIRWGGLLPELRAAASGGHWHVVEGAQWSTGAFEAHVGERARARDRARRRAVRESHRAGAERVQSAATPPASSTRRRAVPAARRSSPDAHRGDDRRRHDLIADASREEDRRTRPAVLERRIRPGEPGVTPFPDGVLSRSSYEQVFLHLVAGDRLRLEGDVHVPLRMRGWYHAVFRRERDGQERVVSIDEMLAASGEWIRSEAAPLPPAAAG